MRRKSEPATHPRTTKKTPSRSKAKPNDEPKAKDDRKIPANERKAFVWAQNLRFYIKRHKGRFLRDEDGFLHLILNRRRIPLNFDRENYALARLFLDACRVSTVTNAAQIAIQRFTVKADEESARMRFRRFSALSDDRERLYIPIEGGKLLLLTSEKIEIVDNGENNDTLWVEHPYGEPLKYSPGDPKAGLAHFERLLVNTQACQQPEMQWFVAMAEAFLPFVRDVCEARFLVVHIGGTQQGKTSGAQRFTLLHGLGQVKGDYTVATLGNTSDIGLLVMDNKEQANFKQPLIDFCLFLATGAERGRSSKGGSIRVSGYRPVGVVTTIEGAWKAELQERCVEVQYEVKGEKTERESVEEEITKRRHEILSAMIPVLQRWLKLRKEGRNWPNPTPNFQLHFRALCELLLAFGEVAGKPEGWSQPIIDAWNSHIGRREPEEDVLEPLLIEFFENGRNDDICDVGPGAEAAEYKGKKGKLLVTDCSRLLIDLRKLNPRDNDLPRNAAGLSRRLHSSTFLSLQVLDETKAPKISALRRTSKRRPIGLFFEDE